MTYMLVTPSAELVAGVCDVLASLPADPQLRRWPGALPAPRSSPFLVPCFYESHGLPASGNLTASLWTLNLTTQADRVLNSGPDTSYPFVVQSLSRVQLFVNPWTAARQASLSLTVSAAAAKSLQLCPTLQPHRRQHTRLPHPWDSPGKNPGVGWHFLLQCMKVKSESEVAQSCPTLSDLMDCSPPGSPVPGILQPRILEWVAISSSSA